MTEQHDSYQNAIVERVNGVLKQEFLINTKNIDLKIMQQIIKQSIGIYNTKKLHLSCNMLTPEQIHKQCEIKRKTYKKCNSYLGLIRSIKIKPFLFLFLFVRRLLEFSETFHSLLFYVLLLSLAIYLDGIFLPFFDMPFSLHYL